MAYDREDSRYDRDFRSGYGRSDAGRDHPQRDRYGRPDRPEDRGFFERAGDEVRSWFGDEEAERRRRYDERYDNQADRESFRADRGYGRGYGDRASYPSYARSNRDEGAPRGGYSGSRPYSPPYGQEDSGRQFGDEGGSAYGSGYGFRRDPARDAGYRSAYRDRNGADGFGDRQADYASDDHHGYHGWRSRQIDAFDRDYDEYRRENQSRFESEFATWRQNRQTQRDLLQSVKEHQEVVGSDGEHVGTVDHVRADHILLTKTDRDAGGHHHSIPSSWIATVADTVKLTRTAAEAKRTWRDAEDKGGLFERDPAKAAEPGAETHGKLGRSFSGTY